MASVRNRSLHLAGDGFSCPVIHGGCAGRRARHVRPMARSIDSRRTLTPREYFLVPEQFGRDHRLVRVQPEGGDRVSARFASQQHLLACAWRQVATRHDVGIVCAQWGFSKHVLYRALSGDRWMNATTLMAVLPRIMDLHSSAGPIAAPTG